MIYCPKCGRELPDEASFCAACGSKILMRRDDPPAGEVKAEEPKPVSEPVRETKPDLFSSGSIRETLGVPPAPVVEPKKPAPKEEPKPVPAAEPARGDIREEEPRRKKADQPISAYSLLAVIGFAMAFVSPIPAIILSALAKSAGRKKHADTYLRLANWGLFLGIVFLAALVGLMIMTYTMWISFVTDIFK